MTNLNRVRALKAQLKEVQKTEKKKADLSKDILHNIDRGIAEIRNEIAKSPKEKKTELKKVLKQALDLQKDVKRTFSKDRIQAKKRTLELEQEIKALQKGRK